MAIVTAVANSFKQELAQGIHDFNNDVFRIALYTPAATLNANTTNYAALNEVTSTGYTAGGLIVQGLTLSISGGIVLIDFDDLTWSGVTFVARGALLYNSSKVNRAIAVWDFGSDRSVTSSDFTVVVPTATASTAVLRIL